MSGNCTKSATCIITGPQEDSEREQQLRVCTVCSQDASDTVRFARVSTRIRLRRRPEDLPQKAAEPLASAAISDGETLHGSRLQAVPQATAPGVLPPALFCDRGGGLAQQRRREDCEVFCPTAPCHAWKPLLLRSSYLCHTAHHYGHLHGEKRRPFRTFDNSHAQTPEEPAQTRT